MAELNNKQFSEKQEKLIASELGGYQISGSGSRPFAPGDVKTYEWLIECKTHTKPDQNILFDINVWKKIEDEAMATQRKPVLVVDDGSQSVSRTWCLCRANNINLTGFITLELPMKIRKNITCKHDKLVKGLKDGSKGLVFSEGFYQDAVYETHWGDEDVLVMPFKIFKELFEQ